MGELVLIGVASAAVFVLAGTAQAATGFGMALAALPLLTLVVDPVPAVVGTVAVSAVVTALAWRRERGHVDREAARRLAATGVVGMPLGLVALAVLSERTLVLVIAGVVLLLVAALAADVRLPSGRVVQGVAGVTSGALLTSTSMNGPPLVLALHGARLAPRTFRATLQAVFCVQDVLALGAFLVVGLVDPVATAIAIGGSLAVPLGWRLGDRLFHRLDADVFRRVVLGGLVLSVAVAVAGAV